MESRRKKMIVSRLYQGVTIMVGEAGKKETRNEVVYSVNEKIIKK